MIDAWAARHGVSAFALNELRAMMAVDYNTPPNEGATGSEGRVQSIVRLEAPHYDVQIYRNNVGMLFNDGGVPVRYGLANDTKKLNQKIKSADLIGWRRVVITPAMVGTTIAQFVSRECKWAGWSFNPTDAHEAAQKRWAELVTMNGGDAKFVTGPGSFDT